MKRIFFTGLCFLALTVGVSAQQKTKVKKDTVKAISDTAAKVLDEVRISSRYYRRYNLNKSSAALKLSTPLLQLPQNIQEIDQRLCKKIPGFEPIAVNIPTVKGVDILLRGHMPQTTNVLLQGKASGITFDAQTGEMKEKKVIDEQGLSDRLEYMAYELHAGAFGGDVLKWVYVIFGLTPGFLSLSGALLWLKRKKR